MATKDKGGPTDNGVPGTSDIPTWFALGSAMFGETYSGVSSHFLPTSVQPVQQVGPLSQDLFSRWDPAAWVVAGWSSVDGDVRYEQSPRDLNGSGNAWLMSEAQTRAATQSEEVTSFRRSGSRTTSSRVARRSRPAVASQAPGARRQALAQRPGRNLPLLPQGVSPLPLLPAALGEGLTGDGSYLTRMAGNTSGVELSSTSTPSWIDLTSSPSEVSALPVVQLSALERGFAPLDSIRQVLVGPSPALIPQVPGEVSAARQRRSESLTSLAQVSPVVGSPSASILNPLSPPAGGVSTSQSSSRVAGVVVPTPAGRVATSRGAASPVMASVSLGDNLPTQRSSTPGVVRTAPGDNFSYSRPGRVSQLGREPSSILRALTASVEQARFSPERRVMSTPAERVGTSSAIQQIRVLEGSAAPSLRAASPSTPVPVARPASVSSPGPTAGVGGAVVLPSEASAAAAQDGHFLTSATPRIDSAQVPPVAGPGNAPRQPQPAATRDTSPPVARVVVGSDGVMAGGLPTTTTLAGVGVGPAVQPTQSQSQASVQAATSAISPSASVSSARASAPAVSASAAVSSAPTAVVSTPAAVSSAPTAVVSASAAVSSAPTAVVSAPTQVSSAPTAVVSAPAAVSPAPTAVVSAPTQVSSAPTAVVSAPAQVSSAPTAVVATPAVVSSAPTAVVSTQTQGTSAPTQVAEGSVTPYGLETAPKATAATGSVGSIGVDNLADAVVNPDVITTSAVRPLGADAGLTPVGTSTLVVPNTPPVRTRDGGPTPAEGPRGLVSSGTRYADLKMAPWATESSVLTLGGERDVRRTVAKAVSTPQLSPLGGVLAPLQVAGPTTSAPAGRHLDSPLTLPMGEHAIRSGGVQAQAQDEKPRRSGRVIAAGRPSSEGRLPGAGASPAGVTSPVSGISTPAMAPTAPVSGALAPVTAINASQAGVSAPVTAINASQVGVSAPIAAINASQAGVSAPVTAINASQAGVSAPIAAINASPAGVSAPIAGVGASPAGASVSFSSAEVSSPGETPRVPTASVQPQTAAQRISALLSRVSAPARANTEVASPSLTGENSPAIMMRSSGITPDQVPGVAPGEDLSGGPSAAGRGSDIFSSTPVEGVAAATMSPVSPVFQPSLDVPTPGVVVMPAPRLEVEEDTPASPYTRGVGAEEGPVARPQLASPTRMEPLPVRPWEANTRAPSSIPSTVQSEVRAGGYQRRERQGVSLSGPSILATPYQSSWDWSGDGKANPFSGQGGLVAERVEPTPDLVTAQGMFTRGSPVAADPRIEPVSASVATSTPTRAQGTLDFQWRDLLGARLDWLESEDRATGTPSRVEAEARDDSTPGARSAAFPGGEGSRRSPEVALPVRPISRISTAEQVPGRSATLLNAAASTPVEVQTHVAGADSGTSGRMRRAAGSIPTRRRGEAAGRLSASTNTSVAGWMSGQPTSPPQKAADAAVLTPKTREVLRQIWDQQQGGRPTRPTSTATDLPSWTVGGAPGEGFTLVRESSTFDRRSEGGQRAARPAPGLASTSALMSRDVGAGPVQDPPTTLTRVLTPGEGGSLVAQGRHVPSLSEPTLLTGGIRAGSDVLSEGAPLNQGRGLVTGDRVDPATSPQRVGAPATAGAISRPEGQNTSALVSAPRREGEGTSVLVSTPRREGEGTSVLVSAPGHEGQSISTLVSTSRSEGANTSTLVSTPLRVGEASLQGDGGTVSAPAESPREVSSDLRQDRPPVWREVERGLLTSPTVSTLVAPPWQSESNDTSGIFQWQKLLGARLSGWVEEAETPPGQTVAASGVSRSSSPVVGPEALFMPGATGELLQSATAPLPGLERVEVEATPRSRPVGQVNEVVRDVRRSTSAQPSLRQLRRDVSARPEVGTPSGASSPATGLHFGPGSQPSSSEGIRVAPGGAAPALPTQEGFRARTGGLGTSPDFAGRMGESRDPGVTRDLANFPLRVAQTLEGGTSGDLVGTSTPSSVGAVVTSPGTSASNLPLRPGVVLPSLSGEGTTAAPGTTRAGPGSENFETATSTALTSASGRQAAGSIGVSAAGPTSPAGEAPPREHMRVQPLAAASDWGHLPFPLTVLQSVDVAGGEPVDVSTRSSRRPGSRPDHQATSSRGIRPSDGSLSARTSTPRPSSLPPAANTAGVPAEGVAQILAATARTGGGLDLSSLPSPTASSYVATGGARPQPGVGLPTPSASPSIVGSASQVDGVTAAGREGSPSSLSLASQVGRIPATGAVLAGQGSGFTPTLQSDLLPFTLVASSPGEEGWQDQREGEVAHLTAAVKPWVEGHAPHERLSLAMARTYTDDLSLATPQIEAQRPARPSEVNTRAGLLIPEGAAAVGSLPTVVSGGRPVVESISAGSSAAGQVSSRVRGGHSLPSRVKRSGLPTRAVVVETNPGTALAERRDVSSQVMARWNRVATRLSELADASGGSPALQRLGELAAAAATVSPSAQTSVLEQVTHQLVAAQALAVGGGLSAGGGSTQAVSSGGGMSPRSGGVPFTTSPTGSGSSSSTGFAPATGSRPRLDFLFGGGAEPGSPRPSPTATRRSHAAPSVSSRPGMAAASLERFATSLVLRPDPLARRGAATPGAGALPLPQGLVEQEGGEVKASAEQAISKVMTQDLPVLHGDAGAPESEEETPQAESRRARTSSRSAWAGPRNTLGASSSLVKRPPVVKGESLAAPSSARGIERASLLQSNFSAPMQQALVQAEGRALPSQPLFAEDVDAVEKVAANEDHDPKQGAPQGDVKSQKDGLEEVIEEVRWRLQLESRWQNELD